MRYIGFFLEVLLLEFRPFLPSYLGSLVGLPSSAFLVLGLSYDKWVLVGANI